MSVEKGSASGGPGYAGDVSPPDVWAALKAVPAAQLVDVRTRPEWTYVGQPDLSGVGKEPVLLEWQVYPGMAVSPDFVEDLITALEARKASRADPVYFLCRSGVRSRAAAIALTAAGYTRCYNITGGFEGPHDANRRRGSTDGWKSQGLPWSQS